MQKTGEILEKISRQLVEVQLELLKLQKNPQREGAEGPSLNPLADEAAFHPGPPQILKLAVPVFPPKIQVHGLRYPKGRAQPTTYQQVRETWLSAIRKTFFSLVKEKSACNLITFEKAVVWVCFYFPDLRIRDVDNYSLKFINDALVACRILQDDDHRRLRLIVEGAVDKERPRTEMLIVEDDGFWEQLRDKFWQHI